MNYSLVFKWSTSRGRDTYGDNICSLLVNDKKVASTCGGNYDMKGVVLARWMEKEFREELLKIEKKYHGLQCIENKPILNGVCGFLSMESILNALGYVLLYAGETKNTIHYVCTRR